MLTMRKEIEEIQKRIAELEKQMKSNQDLGPFSGEVANVPLRSERKFLQDLLSLLPGQETERPFSVGPYERGYAVYYGEEVVVRLHLQVSCEIVCNRLNDLWSARPVVETEVVYVPVKPSERNPDEDDWYTCGPLEQRMKYEGGKWLQWESVFGDEGYFTEVHPSFWLERREVPKQGTPQSINLKEVPIQSIAGQEGVIMFISKHQLEKMKILFDENAVIQEIPPSTPSEK